MKTVKIGRKPDLIFVPSYNSARVRFQQLAHFHVENRLAYIVISNGAKIGGNSIFGRMKRSHFAGLSARGFKEEGDSTLKLCELKDVSPVLINQLTSKYSSF